MASGNDIDIMKYLRRFAGITGVIAVLLLAGIIWLAVNSSSCSRTLSRWQAEYGRGVEREVTLYSASGEQVGHWEGIIDVEYIDDRVDPVFFDERGAVSDRVIVNPGAGTLVVDETNG